MPRFLCSLAAFVALVATPALAETVVVEVGHNRLEPAELTIAVGSTVTFHNQDEMPGGHTIVAADGSFESPPLAKDQEWSHSFEKAGTYAYTIEQHPTAKGIITVK